MWAWYVPVNEFGQFLVAISVQHWFLTHHPHFLQPHWSHCLCCALLLPWPTSHQSLPGALSSVLRTHECSHCARAPWVCSEGRTMHQVPFLVHILGLSSRHREICRENDLWGVFLVFVYESFFFFFSTDVFVFIPDQSPWQRVSGLGQEQILVTLSGLCCG